MASYEQDRRPVTLDRARPRLESTVAPFTWGLPGGDGFDPSASLVGAYCRHLTSVGIEVEEGSREPGRLWTPLVDLALAPLITKPWMSWEPAAFFPARWVPQVAAGLEATVLPRGTILRFEEHSRNPAFFGWDSLIWSAVDASLDVSFLWSADDLKGGSDGVLANHLIVPIEHALVGDDATADQLVRELQAIRLSVTSAVAP